MIQIQTPSMMTVPISTVNITGLRNMTTGSSLTKDCFSASFTRAGSNNLLALLCLDMVVFLFKTKELRYRYQCQCREERQGRHDDDHGKGHDTECARIRFERTCAFRDILLFGQDTGYRHRTNDGQKTG